MELYGDTASQEKSKYFPQMVLYLRWWNHFYKQIRKITSNQQQNESALGKAIKVESIIYFRQDLELEQEVAFQQVHIRCTRVRGRKYVTSISGLDSRTDFKGILKLLKKSLNCNGNLEFSESHGNIIQISGDQREFLTKILINQDLCSNDQIVMH